MTPAGTARDEAPAASGASEAAESVPAESERRNGKHSVTIEINNLLFK